MATEIVSKGHVRHCRILEHEEHDMMRPLVVI
jgi:FtsP/CotA-like multicopper oxidase with cupredoxin domain